MADQAVSFWKDYSEERPLNVMVVGRTKCEKDYAVSRECSKIMAVEYIRRGRGTLVINGKSYAPGANSAVLLTRGSCHRYTTDENDLWEKEWIVFGGRFAEEVASLYLPPHEYCFENCDLSPFFDEISRTVKEYEGQYAHFLDRVCVILLRMFLKMKNSLPPRREDLAAQVRRLIDENVESRLSLDALAEKLSYSRNHIIRVFRQRYGVTPYRYYLERKISVAKLYLCNTNYSIEKISGVLCFADAHYFSNCFQEFEGMPPSRYRRCHGGGTGAETPAVVI